MNQNRFWLLSIILLVAVIAVSGTIAWSKYRPAPPIEIALKTLSPLPADSVSVTGAVNNPGIYPLKPGDDFNSVIQAAGGLTNTADAGRISMNVPLRTASPYVQKININRAEVWLLEALPGIGTVKAKAIVAYRQQNGDFHNTLELTNVDGISPTLYGQIKDLIAVTD